jgi:hypothetical protein
MCSHISKVLEWGFTEAHDFKAVKYGCTNCDATSSEPFEEVEVVVDHTKCGGPDKCFGCKARGLQLSTGDASSQKQTSNKKWEGELDAYRAARAEGIQPAGTTMDKIQEARRASDAMGAAYDANTMASTNLIQNNTVDKLKEVGLV